MIARYLMELHVSTGGYEIRPNGDRDLLLMGDRGVQIYERWRCQHASSAAKADAYLEGVTDGIIFEMSGVR